MNILIACEYSGVVREAFKKKGFKAVSCDLLPTEIEGEHYQGSVLDIINEGWDVMIAFPPCTYLTVSGNRHFVNNPERWEKMVDALKFVKILLDADIEHIALENPIGRISSFIRKPDQIVHPYYFGDTIPKKTGLWLKNLPLLEYDTEDNLFNQKSAGTPFYIEYNSKSNKSGKSKYSVLGKLGKGKGKERSLLSTKLAEAMAEQWGNFLKSKYE